MKQFKIAPLVLAFLLFVVNTTYSQTTNEWGNPVLGAQLSISISNNIIPIGSTVFLQCLSTNFSTNGVCFTRTDSRWMYEVSIINSSGKSFVLTGPEFADDSSDRRHKINQGESYGCLVPLVFDRKIGSGSYKIIAKQDIFLFRNANNKSTQRGQLISNPLNIEVK